MTLSRRDLLFGRFFRRQRPQRAQTEDPGDRFVHRPGPRAGAAAAASFVAKVLPFSCLNKLGGFCSTCVERCPLPDAIALDGRVPTVDASVCDGCGQCASLCPAPGGAVTMVPQ